MSDQWDGHVMDKIGSNHSLEAHFNVARLVVVLIHFTSLAKRSVSQSPPDTLSLFQTSDSERPVRQSPMNFRSNIHSGTTYRVHSSSTLYNTIGSNHQNLIREERLSALDNDGFSHVRNLQT